MFNMTNMRRHIRRWNGSRLVWETGAYRETVSAIREEKRRTACCTRQELTEKARCLRKEAASGVDAGTLLVPSFALVAEAVLRTLECDPFDEQLVCGVVLHQGRCGQMQTGEGKTIAAVFSAFLNALDGKGVHVLTFNDYLARRDAEWMRPAYEFLGLSVGFIQGGMSEARRRGAYRMDVTYGTAKEAGFDFLRDSTRHLLAPAVQRDPHYAIIDEADSILIDEARIPMVIATSTEGADDHLELYARIAGLMMRDRHFTFDAYARNIILTDEGIDFAERQLGCGNLFSSENGNLCCLYHALHAEHLLHRNVDYLVRNGRVELVDELTGRVAERRRWPDGLHSAVEAKERCPVQPRGAVLCSITMHHFIARYTKIAGMTATAECAEEELHDWYGLDTVVIPPHRLCIRTDFPDRIYRTRQEKNDAVVGEIAAVHSSGRPILVGTRTVRDSEELAELLRNRSIDCRVLNAKDNVCEAAVIAEAGAVGAVTISTNMAGRGTDIRLGGSDEHDREAVVSLGGLYVIGTNRFESRRIDNQLRGRSGRQGDPGASRFFISLEDDLFVKYRLQELIPGRCIVAGKDGCVENRLVSGEVNRLQRIIEGQNGDIKFNLAKYAALVEQQRGIIAEYRNALLSSPEIPEPFLRSEPGTVALLESLHGRRTASRICRVLLLEALDRSWSLHIADMTGLRDGIHLRAFGRQDPLCEFNRCAIERFSPVISDAEFEAAERLRTASADELAKLMSPAGRLDPSATWTYMVNDNPFEDKPDLLMTGGTGFSVAAGLLWPLTALAMLIGRRKRRKTD